MEQREEQRTVDGKAVSVPFTTTIARNRPSYNFKNQNQNDLPD